MMSDNLLKDVVVQIDRQSNLGEIAYERLKQVIVGGSFPAGEKLTVRSVAAALGVSTTPARDAINRLLAEGALVNEGPKTVILPTLTLASLEEVTATRLALEGLAAERSVGAVTAADIVELKRLQAIINDGLDRGSYTEVLSANREFHFLIYRRSGWKRLVGLIESLWLQVGPSLNGLYPDFAKSRKGVANHMAAFKGYKKKDPAAVRAAIEQDIKDGYASLKAYIKAQN
jgi:DNA-binding GntR family transcriptional regulator